MLLWHGFPYLADNTVNASSNTFILNSKIDYVMPSKRFDDPIFLGGRERVHWEQMG